MNKEIKIIINNQPFYLDVDKAMQLRCLRSKISVGQKYTHKESLESYILAFVTHNGVALINLDTGTRWSDAAVVYNCHDITAVEFDNITENSSDKFTIIND